MSGPVRMRLPCERCGTLHIDRGEFSTRPHHTHQCEECGLVWRPAIVDTVGVRFLWEQSEDPGLAEERARLRDGFRRGMARAIADIHAMIDTEETT